MKCAYTTTLLEQDGVPFGIELSWGRRTEHERGVGRLIESLALRQHADGQMIACTRRLGQRLFFARGTLDGEDQAVLELVPEYDAKPPTSTLRTLRRHVDALGRLCSMLDDEQAGSKRVVRGAWDDSTFVVHVRRSGNADALEFAGWRLRGGRLIGHLRSGTESAGAPFIRTELPSKYRPFPRLVCAWAMSAALAPAAGQDRPPPVGRSPSLIELSGTSRVHFIESLFRGWQA